MSDLLHLSAGELLARYRASTLSQVEVLDAVPARADAVAAEARYAGRAGDPSWRPAL